MIAKLTEAKLAALRDGESVTVVILNPCKGTDKKFETVEIRPL